MRGLLDLAPEQATRIAADGAEQIVDAVALAPGDIVLIRPGERVPADGRVVGGASEVDLAGADRGDGAGGLGDQGEDAAVHREDRAALFARDGRARRVVVANLVIAAAVIAGLVTWDLAATLPLPLGVLGHEGSTVVVGLNGLRLLRKSVWRAAMAAGSAA